MELESERDYSCPACGMHIPSRTGSERIRFERCRQVLLKGFSFDHDDRHVDGELAMAALAYVNAGLVSQCRPNTRVVLSLPNNALGWPWGRSEWKPSDDPIENLVRAGALIAAEIDRLLRLREEK
jgi:hypothetical protein